MSEADGYFGGGSSITISYEHCPVCYAFNGVWFGDCNVCGVELEKYHPVIARGEREHKEYNRLHKKTLRKLKLLKIEKPLV